jgi:hypothetical protein
MPLLPGVFLPSNQPGGAPVGTVGGMFWAEPGGGISARLDGKLLSCIGMLLNGGMPETGEDYISNFMLQIAYRITIPVNNILNVQLVNTLQQILTIISI